MNKRRLLKLADFLENEVPAKHFDLYSWATPQFSPKSTTRGSTACACGWATVCFKNCKREKLQLGSSFDLIYKNKLTGHTFYRFNAAITFFDISPDACDYLFDPWSYSKFHSGPKYVAKRIRKFVETNGILPDVK